MSEESPIDTKENEAPTPVVSGLLYYRNNTQHGVEVQYFAGNMKANIDTKQYYQKSNIVNYFAIIISLLRRMIYGHIQVMP